MKLPRQAHQPKRDMKVAFQKRGFSLTEVLVVISIMSILAALTMTSVSSLRTVSLTSSGNEVVDAFAMARQNSLSKSAYTAIVIKTGGGGAGSAYCLMELTRQDDGSFGVWTAITPWHFLGKGSVFDVHPRVSSVGTGTDTFMPSSVLPQPLPTAFPFQGQQIDLTTTTLSQCYQPDGTLITQPGTNTRLVLRLTEGQVDSSSGAVTYQGKLVSGHPVNYYDLVFVGDTGVTKIERY